MRLPSFEPVRYALKRRLLAQGLAMFLALAAGGLAVDAAHAMQAEAAPQAAASQAIADATPDAARVALNGRVFDRVWGLIRDQYYDPQTQGVDWAAARETYRPQALAAPDERALYRVLQSMLGLLNDHHASAQSPAMARNEDNARKSRVVLGLSLMLEADRGWRILSVRKDSAAEKAGLTPGWWLKSINGRDWEPGGDLVEGQPVDLVLVDEQDQARHVMVTPGIMPPVPLFSLDRTRPGVTVLTITRFENGLGRWMGEALAQTPADDLVVLDLRGNPGGQLSEAEALLSCFLPRNTAWGGRTLRSGRYATMATRRPCGDLRSSVGNPLAVLVDRASGSAAELTPAALSEARRAIIVGKRTAGSVLISQKYGLPDGGRMSVSRQDFVTIGGVRLEKHGVTPDIEAETTYDDRRAGREPTLDAAISALRAEAARSTQASAAAKAA